MKRFSMVFAAILAVFLTVNCASSGSVAFAQRETVELDGSLQRTFAFNPGGRLTLQNHNGEIEITSWDKNEVDVDITERYGDRDRKIEIEFDADKDRITIIARQPRSFRNWNWGNRRSPQAHFVVKVPKEIELDISSHNGAIEASVVNGPVEVHTHNGRVRLSDITGDLTAETHNGDIDVRNVEGRMRFESHNGDIEFNRTNGEVESMVHNGTIVFVDVKSPRLSAETNNGSIRGEFEPTEDGDYDFSSHNGRLDIRIPENSKLSVDARCRYRNFDTDFTELKDDWEDRRDRRDRRRDWDDRTRIYGKINGGGGRMTLESYNGSIRLRAR